MARKKIKFVAGGILIGLAVVYLIYSSARQTMVYYLTTSEVMEKVPSVYNERIRLSGKLQPGSLNWDGTGIRAEFNLTDDKAKVIKVVYQGVVPDGLKTAEEVVAEGRYLPAGFFQADNLLVKCPSKYESAKNTKVSAPARGGS